MFSHSQTFMFTDVEPFRPMLKDLANRASLDTITSSNIFLTCVWVVTMILAYGFAINVEQTLLTLLSTRRSQRRNRLRDAAIRP